MINTCNINMILLWAGINVILIIKNMKLFEDPKYKYCHKIIPFIRPLKPSLLNYYSAVSSYLYHQDIYDSFELKDTNVTPQEMVYSIVNSIVSISSIEPCYYKYSIPFHLCKYFGLNEIIPIGVDVLFNSKPFIIYYMFVLVTYIKPFHNMNPLATHILMIIMRQSF